MCGCALFAQRPMEMRSCGGGGGGGVEMVGVTMRDIDEVSVFPTHAQRTTTNVVLCKLPDTFIECMYRNMRAMDAVYQARCVIGFHVA